MEPKTKALIESPEDILVLLVCFHNSDPVHRAIFRIFSNVVKNLKTVTINKVPIKSRFRLVSKKEHLGNILQTEKARVLVVVTDFHNRHQPWQNTLKISRMHQEEVIFFVTIPRQHTKNATIIFKERIFFVKTENAQPLFVNQTIDKNPEIANEICDLLLTKLLTILGFSFDWLSVEEKLPFPTGSISLIKKSDLPKGNIPDTPRKRWRLL